MEITEDGEEIEEDAIEYDAEPNTDKQTANVEIDVGENPFDFEIPQKVKCVYSDAYKHARWLMNNEKDYKAAYKELIVQVKDGNLPAMFDLAKLYYNNLLEEKDDKKAEFLFKCALNGYTILEKAGASDFYEYQIGRIYGLKASFQDYIKARQWLELSARKGNRYAMFSLGNIHYYGNGTEVDYEKAYRYFRLSASQECVHSYFKLGYMLRKGIGCKEDVCESDWWFAKMIAYFAIVILLADILLRNLCFEIR